jgi:SAM-dependent methyltransferase
MASRYETLDRINRATWSSGTILAEFATREGPFDPGEALVLRRVADEAEGLPILDIGVGAGRTVPLLRAVSTDYVGIDYLKEMVTLARSRFPDVRFEHVDARDLSRFASRSFGLVYFSRNGIDGVGHEDRRTVLREIHRVLRPCGLFAYSTHNLDHRFAGRPPWHPGWYRADPRLALYRARRLPARAAAYRESRAECARGDGWATLVDPAYEFGLVTHFVTLEEALRELREAGFETATEIYSTTGVRLHPWNDTRKTFWLHLVARRP